MVKVKNIHGTSKERYAKSYPQNYKSWLDYWNDKCIYNSLVTNCQCCGGKKEVGGHVIKEKCENDKKWYIIPLCRQCNSPSNENYFFVDEDFLVPVSEKNIKESDDIDDLLNELIDDDIF